VPRAGRENEIVERNAFRVQQDFTGNAVHADHLTQANRHVALIAQDTADRQRDIGG
jgi:hypothetical protein